ncbi:hypothetical protein VNO77_27238 [Canavalia gladiata]|uniref:Uncharacterized protein n=1 Tax=Canavalia gladiata TaxID=3824 RepID=A0AAN9Q6A2_CANGL
MTLQFKMKGPFLGGGEKNLERETSEDFALKKDSRGKTSRAFLFKDSWTWLACGRPSIQQPSFGNLGEGLAAFLVLKLQLQDLDALAKKTMDYVRSVIPNTPV